MWYHVLVNILLYADDISLVSENEEDLQKRLTCIAEWCKKWELCINQKKTQVMHFSKNFQFFCIGEKQLEFTDKYRYPVFFSR